MHHCKDSGYLIGTDDWYPSEPCDYQFFPLGPRIGCTHLACPQCGQTVRMAAGRALDVPTAAPVVFDSNGLAGSRVQAQTRIYACRCTAVATTGAMTAYAPNADPTLRPATIWRCAGHAPLTLPLPSAAETAPDLSKIGQPLAPGHDWNGWLDRLADGSIAPSFHPKMDAIAGFAAHRLFHVLGDPDERRLLGDAIVAGLDGSVSRREIALRFFAIEIESPWDPVLFAHEAAARTWAEAGIAGDDAQRRLYLRWVEAISWRLDDECAPGTNAERARDLLRAHAQQAPGIGAVIYKLRAIGAA